MPTAVGVMLSKTPASTWTAVPSRTRRLGKNNQAKAASSFSRDGTSHTPAPPPTWIFHGAKDDLVPPDDDRKLIAAFRAAGAPDARYTEFPDANHNSWDPAYSQTPEFWTWLFAQRRPSKDG